MEYNTIFHRFTNLSLYIGLLIWLASSHVDCTANIPGSATVTQVTHFTFLQNLGNPCRIVRELPAETSTSSSMIGNGNGTGSLDLIEESESARIKILREFYQSMVTAIAIALENIVHLENADPTMPECNGLYLESLPPTPPMDTMKEGRLFKQVYQTGIYLAAHLRIMELDRQRAADGNNDIPDDQVVEGEVIPSWRVFRCGNESSSILTSIHDATERVEDILCTLVSSATLSQRATFRTPFNRLMEAKIFRYHNSCSLIQTRDCLVVREAKQSISYMLTKFSSLLEAVTEPIVSVGNASEEMENSL